MESREYVKPIVESVEVKIEGGVICGSKGNNPGTGGGGLGPGQPGQGGILNGAKENNLWDDEYDFSEEDVK